MSELVTLGPDEVAIARLVGSRRFRSCRLAGSPDVHYDHDPSAEQQDWNAAGAEIAVAKVLNRWPTAFSWTGAGNKGADVDGRQVRHTRHENGRLLIYAEDDDEQRFVFVVGELPTFRIVGWIRGLDAKQARWWATAIGGFRLQCPCYALPQCALRPLPTTIVTAWQSREREARVRAAA